MGQRVVRRLCARCRIPSRALTAAEVDALSSYTMETNDEVQIAKNVGFGDVTYFSQIGYGGGAACATYRR